MLAGGCGNAVLAGAAAGGSLFYPCLMFLSGLSSGCSAQIGRLRGNSSLSQQGTAHIHAALNSAVLCALILGAILCISALCLISLPEHAQLEKHLRWYLFFAALALPDAALLFVLKAVCDAAGAARLSLLTGLSLLCLNLPCNMILLYGFNLGGAGCGLSALISISGSAALLLLVIKKRYRILWQLINLPGLKLNPVYIRSFLKEALPLGLAAALESSAFALIALLLTPCGARETAAHSIAMSVNSLIFSLPLSLSIAACIRGAQAVGAQAAALYRDEFIALCFCSLLVMLLSFSFTFSLRDILPTLFTSDQITAQRASYLLGFALFTQIFENAQCVLSFQLRAFGAGRSVLAVTLLTFYVCALPLGLALCYGLSGSSYGATGFWLALLTALPIASCIYALRLYKLYHKFFCKEPGQCLI